jgi:response regulator RpfG family c-di-GMP phosphodiesterase
MGARIVISYHEKWDGAGYPNGIKGEDIPKEGRIMAIIDVIDALLTKRCYKKPWPQAKVKEYLIEQSGKQFDPNLVTLCIKHFSEFASSRDELSDP